MVAVTRFIVRPFDESLSDAERILSVEQATFDECPYDAGQVRDMFTEGEQRAWLAIAGDSVAGFVIAFPTGGLHGQRWELDLLAVLPNWRGRGLAARLIRAAGAYGAGVARRARAAVAADNNASTRAFTHAGFRAEPETCKLLIYRTHGATPHPWSTSGTTVREAATIADATGWLPEQPAFEKLPGLTLLLAEQDGGPAGYAELIEVQTLLYRGVWIESLVAPAHAACEALVHYAVNRAIEAGLDEIGAMVPDDSWSLRDSLLGRGFRSLGDFRWFTAGLPLPGLATPPASPPCAG